MNKIILTLTILCIAAIPFCYAQTAYLEWAKQLGGEYTDQATCLTIDNSGNIIMAGIFHDIIDIDPGPGALNFTAVGLSDAFIVKLDANGNLIWANQTGSSAQDRINEIAVDASGNIYLTGRFEGTMDFDPGTGIVNLTSAGSNDVYVQKLNTNGDLIWVKQLGGTSDESVTALAIDNQGNVVVGGTFSGTADFDPGPGQDNMSPVGIYDVFITKLNVDGDYIWARQFGGNSIESCTSIAIDGNDNIHSIGWFVETANFDFPGGNATLTSVGNADVFIHKMDGNGNFSWVRQIGGTDSDTGESITVDATGNVYSTGFFEGTSDFDPSAGSLNLTASGDKDLFVQKLDNNGVMLWSKISEGSSSSLAQTYSVDLDASNNVYIAGVFLGTVDFEPGQSGTSFTSTDGSMFIQKLDENGNFDWTKAFTGKGFARRVLVDDLDNIYSIGHFSSTVDFDPGNATFDLTPHVSSSQSADAYILKLGQCSVSDLTTSVSGSTITANNSSAAYQWVDCNNNNAIIPGETNASFTPTQNGNYAVSITENGCTETSDCVAITTVGIDELIDDQYLTISPNPSSGTFHVEFEKTIESAQFSVTDVQGKIIESMDILDTNSAVIELKQPCGVYFLTVITPEFKQTVRLVKQ